MGEVIPFPWSRRQDEIAYSLVDQFDLDAEAFLVREEHATGWTAPTKASAIRRSYQLQQSTGTMEIEMWFRPTPDSEYELVHTMTEWLNEEDQPWEEFPDE